jgi:MSHA biogenesis protein MshI
VSALALEVQRSLDYYESHYDQTPIGDLVVAPLLPAFANLASRLTTEIGLRVSLLDLNAALDSRNKLTPELQGQCLFAIGAALRRQSRAL